MFDTISKFNNDEKRCERKIRPSFWEEGLFSGTILNFRSFFLFFLFFLFFFWHVFYNFRGGRKCWRQLENLMSNTRSGRRPCMQLLLGRIKHLMLRQRADVSMRSPWAVFIEFCWLNLRPLHRQRLVSSARLGTCHKISGCFQPDGGR